VAPRGAREGGRRGDRRRRRAAHHGGLRLRERAQALQVEDPQLAVFHLQQPRALEHLERLVHALARDAGEVADLLLGELDVARLVGIEHRVEEAREGTRHPRVGLEQPLVLDHRDELAQALVQLQQQEAVELDARVEQPLEGGARHVGDAALAQRHHVVLARLVLEERPLPEPAAARHAQEGGRLALAVHARHLDEAVDHPDPALHRLALAADRHPHGQGAHHRLGLDPGHLVGRERAPPEGGFEELGEGFHGRIVGQKTTGGEVQPLH